MTAAQLELIGLLLRSHVFTTDEREALAHRIGQGVSRRQAQRILDRMLSTLKQRKKVGEAAGGNVPPREPGEDDDVPGPDDA